MNANIWEWECECKCTHSFTCRYCLRNRKPWFFTLNSGAGIVMIPFQKKGGGE